MRIRKIAKFCAIALSICALSPISASGYGTKLDNGRNWFQLPNAVSGGGATGIAVSGDGNYVFALDVGGVRVSTDAGATWRDSNTNLDLSLSLSDIAASNSGQYVVVTQNGGDIQMSNNYGGTWRSVAGYPGGYRVAMSSSGQYVAALQIGVGIMFSSDYGASFTMRTFPSGSAFQSDVAISADGRKILVPDHVAGRLMLANGYTAAFQIVSGVPSNSSWGPVAISGDGNSMMATISYKNIMVSRDGGATWFESTVVGEIPDDKNYTAATMSYDGKLIGVARSGSYLLTSSDGGFNWEARPGSGRTGWTGITATQDGMIMYANLSGAEIWKSLPSWIWYDKGTVSFYLPICGIDASKNTSISASSVKLEVDTMTTAANSDGATYTYFTETDTALWGATYDYGETQDPICQYSSLDGNVIIERTRFISSSPRHSETTTNTTDFIQFVGGWTISGPSGYRGSPCGNLARSHAASVTTSCTPGILADYQQLSQYGMVDWRDSTLRAGVLGLQSGLAYTAVKVRKSAIAGAPPSTTFSATETFTLTSV
ncbi:Sialidase_non-viral domain containing protein [Candidatus Nanopelagicaceae bacterium]